MKTDFFVTLYRNIVFSRFSLALALAICGAIVSEEVHGQSEGGDDLGNQHSPTDSWASTNGPVKSVVSQTSEALLDDFEGVLPSLEISKGGALAALRKHIRTDQAPFRGRRCEYISAVGVRGGERILVSQDIAPLAAIEELEISVRLRGNRPGYQLMARVRLPRTKNDRGEPVSVYVYGDRYSKPHNWQRLALSDVSKHIANQVRAMRVQSGFVDGNEAYVDQIAINIYGGPLLNKVWIDDLSVKSGIPVSIEQSTVDTNPGIAKEPVRPRQVGVALANYKTQLDYRAELDFPSAVPRDRNGRATFSGWVPRIVRHDDGPLTTPLRQGFNTVWLARAPSKIQLEEVRKLGLKVICPPFLPAIEVTDLALLASVVAWDLTDTEIEAIGDPSQLQLADGQYRPIISRDNVPWADIRLDSRVDSTRSSRKSVWLESTSGSRWIPIRDQIRKATFARYSGFLFDPQAISPNEASNYAQELGKLFNLELAILEPWIRQRGSLQSLRSVGQTQGYAVLGLAARHGSLVWVRDRYSAKSTSDVRVSSSAFIDLPDARYRDAFYLEPGNLELADNRRIAGGIRLFLPSQKPDGLLLLTDQPEIRQAWKRQLASSGRSYCESLTQVIRYELVYLDRAMNQQQVHEQLANHLRQELHALHGRIAPLMDVAGSVPRYRQLDHLHGQLEKVYQVLLTDVTNGGARHAASK